MQADAVVPVGVSFRLDIRRYREPRDIDPDLGRYIKRPASGLTRVCEWRWRS